MTLSDQFLLSDLLSHSVRCDQGIDHGVGVIAWMHPPVHRLLGWATRPSVLKLSRDVWRLNQIKGAQHNILYVKGNPDISEQATLERLPTLIDAKLLGNNNIKLGLIADLVFEPTTGKILYYLVSRTDPRIPGTSRWKLEIKKIKDQQPGIVLSHLNSLDDLPLVKSSIRQDIMKKSKTIRDQIQEITDKASTKLEGWLEEQPWDQEDINYEYQNISYEESSPNDMERDDWIDDLNQDFNEESKNSPFFYTDRSNKQNTIEEEDPWV